MSFWSQFIHTTSSQFLKKPEPDHVADFSLAWTIVKNTLLFPDERQLTRGIAFTEVPARLRAMTDALVAESTRNEEGATGPCLEYLLKNDVLGTLVHLSEPDRPSGVLAEVLRSVANMVVLLDEQFLVHSAVHRAIIRLLRVCAGDELEERVDGRSRPMGAASNTAKTAPSEYEEDLVDLLCILCGRIRTYRELLMIFFHDKNWFHAQSRPLELVKEEDEDDEAAELPPVPGTEERAASPTPSQQTVTSTPFPYAEPPTPEYEFLIFNYLLRFVHREGKIGEFARAGLLFLMDVAMSAGKPDAQSNELPATPKSEISQHGDPVADAALALAEYMLDGDFAEVLSAGLGAVYSVLPTKLSVQAEPSAVGEHGGMKLGQGAAGSEAEEHKRELERERNEMLGIQSSTDPAFRSHLDHFLKLLEFVQDVLRRNESNEGSEGLQAAALVGNAISQAILDTIKHVFLSNILYTSILECSDTDGSAVAVMSYIDIALRTLRHDLFTDMLVDFLMSENDFEHSHPRKRRRVLTLLDNDAPPRASRATKAERRKSSAMMLLEMEGSGNKPQPAYVTSLERFTLKDLILTNVKSPSESTGTAALQLFQTLLAGHCHSSVEKLLITVSDREATSFPEPSRLVKGNPESPRPATPDSDVFVYPGDETSPAISFDPVFHQPSTTYATHEREMAMYLALVSRIDPAHEDEPFSTGYDHYLRDALVAIQEHSCFLDPHVDDTWKHKLEPNDPLLSQLLQSLRQFFSHTPEYNVALTGVFATLAMCPTRSLTGWLSIGLTAEAASSPLDSTAIAASEDDGDDRSIDFRVEERMEAGVASLPAAQLDGLSQPVLHGLFQSLVQQLDRYRALVPDFDRYLVERRQGLLFTENLSDALSLALEVAVSPAAAATPPRPKARQKSASASLVAFLTPKKLRAESSRPASPPNTPPRQRAAVAASPFGAHYQHTGAIAVEPFVAPVPVTGPWTPVRGAAWAGRAEDVFSDGGWAEDESRELPRDEAPRPEQKISLSQLLDNVVILEESIKELTAILHARRTLGIDSIRFV